MAMSITIKVKVLYDNIGLQVIINTFKLLLSFLLLAKHSPSFSISILLK